MGEMFRKVMEINPNHKNIYYYYSLGLVLYNQNKYEEAEEMFHKSIEKNPNYSYTYFYLGKLLKKRKDYDGSIKMYCKTIELNPNDSDAKFNLSKLFNMDYNENSETEDEYDLKELQRENRNLKEKVRKIQGKNYDLENKIIKMNLKMETRDQEIKEVEEINL